MHSSTQPYLLLGTHDQLASKIHLIYTVITYVFDEILCYNLSLKTTYMINNGPHIFKPKAAFFGSHLFKFYVYECFAGMYDG